MSTVKQQSLYPYVIEMNCQHEYPFKGLKPDHYFVQVRSKFVLGES